MDPSPSPLSPSPRHDWKLYLVIATHLITIGMVYTRITMSISNTDTKLTSVEASISRATTEAASISSAIHDLKLSLSQLSENRRYQSELNEKIQNRVERLEGILLYKEGRGEKIPR